MAGMVSGGMPPQEQAAPEPKPQDTERAQKETRQMDPGEVESRMTALSVKQIMSEESTKILIEAAQKADPAKQIAIAAITIVKGVMDSATGNGQQVDPQMVGDVVVRTIQAGAAVLLRAEITTPDEVEQMIQQATQFAMQGGQPQEQGAPAPQGA